MVETLRFQASSVAKRISLRGYQNFPFQIRQQMSQASAPMLHSNNHRCSCSSIRGQQLCSPRKKVTKMNLPSTSRWRACQTRTTQCYSVRDSLFPYDARRSRKFWQWSARNWLAGWKLTEIAIMIGKMRKRRVVLEIITRASSTLGTSQTTYSKCWCRVVSRMSPSLVAILANSTICSSIASPVRAMA